MSFKTAWGKWWKGEKPQVIQFISCLMGVVLFKALDITGQRFDLAALSLAYVAFAVGISLFITLATDDDPIPKGIDAQQRKKILRRVAKQGILMGFFWQTVLEKMKDLIEL